MFSWQTYNALFIVRCFTKFLVQNNKEADLIRHIETKGELLYKRIISIYIFGLWSTWFDLPQEIERRNSTCQASTQTTSQKIQ